ncbi:unnamed protein product [Psylliodes chrysocephalus]|uniref:VWFC domain-containing protein n=1 Tax=Psylliodes chrysocephalus TaxID=3402493 RepID=A0A9P0GAD3_9CUCU|nr:unnamed protein product [Psylliodes chrysocephala]
MRFSFIVILTFLVTITYAEEENCNYHGHLIYEDLGCKPVTKDGHACPVEYTCNFEIKNNTCNFRGRNLPLHEKLTDDDTYAACIVGCYSTESTPSAECKTSEGKFVEGQRFHPANTCLECVCNKGYEGKNEPPFCRKQMCAAEVRHSEEVHKYCAPHYDGTDTKALCCPDGWVCPSENDKELPANPEVTVSDLKCKYGDKTLKLGERIQGQFKWYDGSLRDSQCECIVPPLLTCREDPKNTPAPTPPTTPSYTIEKIHD